ncbi:SprT family zinc-dependent metalloprotease [Alteromonas sp. 009811495]|uniref:SprT family zinc-dependent metalloprotease n=1 Tax=Alteromonas sp. 009811495 TaxID=3002962 RepID=UPI00237D6E63|nr:SprT family zinc-dependent metalloprotease [Alteromonas sp. 009811495]WDT88138.1 SprT family zinc-dependent metalloprotease [Alteromonas sp. 009811495]
MQDAVFVCYERAERFFDKHFPRPSISYRRSGKNAGTAFLQQNRINFHPLLYKDNTSAFLRDVVPHEVSHLLTWQLYGKVKPHGIEWQAIMKQVFGCMPNTTHSFDIGNTTNTVKYHCLCDNYALTIRRHNKILKGTLYRCKKCSGILKRTSA